MISLWRCWDLFILSTSLIFVTLTDLWNDWAKRSGSGAKLAAYFTKVQRGSIVLWRKKGLPDLSWYRDESSGVQVTPYFLVYFEVMQRYLRSAKRVAGDPVISYALWFFQLFVPFISFRFSLILFFLRFILTIEAVLMVSAAGRQVLENICPAVEHGLVFEKLLQWLRWVSTKDGLLQQWVKAHFIYTERHPSSLIQDNSFCCQNLVSNFKSLFWYTLSRF